ncbi:hypothetical protein BT96DRAFT_1025907 [Gymnopus androsaceus JB14]|uniref:Uncharacterized protein n=1 Tax=Gymnopus androsaceus JB14 TaxID=1447944 RepID=A0A6A4GQ69_9AGAR|nr:hypothetical protein BT96DRAFT_1025907 [Gymnopus androsaceus JB14]
MSLLAYHFAASWLRTPSNHPNSLPTPSQYYHSLDLVADISFTSLYNLLTYTTRQLRKKTTSPANSSPILKTAAFGLQSVFNLQSLQVRIVRSAQTQSIAFIGPSSIPNGNNLTYTAHTYAVSTECQTPDDPNPVIDNSNVYVWSPGFNAMAWQTRLQTFLMLKGNFSAPDNNVPLSSGSNLNSFTTTAKELEAIPSYFVPSRHATQRSMMPNTLSVTRPSRFPTPPSHFPMPSPCPPTGMFLGTGDTQFYQYGSRFLDNQIQLDLSSAGNT